MKMFNLKNIILISKIMGNNTNHGNFFEVGVTPVLEFCALVRTPPDAPKSALPFAFNAEKAELVLTSRRFNVATLPLVDLNIS